MLITALVFMLVITSLGLVIAVPVALATPGEWEALKNDFNNAFQVWIGLIVAIAASDGILSSI